MRRIFLPVGGKSTDANGAASFDVGLERTGDWRNIKASLQLPGPAEWGLFSGGSAITFGRGRRVTLGPELLEPQDQLQVQVTGGPVLQPISGSITGLAGSMEEMLASFAPAPNTIALDAAIPRQKLYPVGAAIPTNPATPSFTVASGGTSGQKVFQLPAGTVEVRILVTAGGLFFRYRLLVTGSQTVEQYYGDPNAPGTSLLVPVPTLPITIPIEFDWDTSVIVVIDNPTQNVNVFVSALFAPEPPGQAGAAQSVVSPVPAPWQAPTLNAPVPVASVASGGAQTVIVATPGATYYLHDYSFSQDNANAASQWQLQDSTGVVISSWFNTNVRTVFGSGNFGGFPITTGRGVQIANGGAAASFVGGFLSYAIG